MTQEQINKLQELKKLLDAGILTQEEMQAEKAKILGTYQEQPVETTPVTENAPVEEPVDEIAEEATPLMTDSNGRIIFDEPKPTQQQPTTPKSNSGNSGVNTKTILIVLGVLAAIIVVVLLSKKSNSEPTYYSEPDEMVAVDSVTDDSYDTYSDTEVISTDDDEFAFDPWIGSVTIDGSMYRTCESRCHLDFKKVSKGEYKGTIVVMLGSTWPDHEERFDPALGYLEGTVRAKSDGNVLTVVMDRYTSRAYNPNSDDTNEYFGTDNISGQIFRITYNGESYTATAIGDMEGYFDAGIEVKK